LIGVRIAGEIFEELLREMIEFGEDELDLVPGLMIFCVVQKSVVLNNQKIRCF
jgi:hypothetical protein